MSRIKFMLMPLLIILLGLFAMKSLFHPGFYTGHDSWHQVARLYHFNKAIIEGQLPPRWSGDLLHGFGYPLFIFSYHLPWWIAEPMVLLGMNIFDAIKLVFIITYILSGLVVFWFVKPIWGESAGFVAAFLYLFTPYRFVNILVRANIGEAVSFVFFPLVFRALISLPKKRAVKYILLGAIGIAGFILSHVMVGFLFFLPLLLTWLVQFLNSKDRLSYFKSVSCMGFLGLGLAAYYLIPAIYYKPLTVFPELYRVLYRNYFVPFQDLVYSKWGYGAVGVPGEMSRQLGLVLWLVLGLVGIWLIFDWLKGRRFNSGSVNWLVFVWLVSCLFSIFMMTETSIPVWKMFEKYTLIDFPFRFLAVTTFFGSLLGGFLVFKAKGLGKILLILFLITGAFYTNRNHLRVNQYTDTPLWLYIDSEQTTNTDDEYLPKWVSRSEVKEKTDLISPELISITDITRQADELSFRYFLLQPTQVQIHHMWFPGITGWVNNQSVSLQKSSNGGIKLELPQGENRLIIKFVPTLVMRLGEVISWLSIGIVGVTGVLYMKKVKIKV